MAIHYPSFFRKLFGRPTCEEMRPLYLYNQSGTVSVVEDFDRIPNGAEFWEYRAVQGPLTKRIVHSIAPALDGENQSN